MGRKIVSLSNLLLLRQEIFLCRDVLKGQHVMLNGRILVFGITVFTCEHYRIGKGLNKCYLNYTVHYDFCIHFTTLHLDLQILRGTT
jgi:hypothetical protein